MEGELIFMVTEVNVNKLKMEKVLEQKIWEVNLMWVWEGIPATSQAGGHPDCINLVVLKCTLEPPGELLVPPIAQALPQRF